MQHDAQIPGKRPHLWGRYVMLCGGLRHCMTFRSICFWYCNEDVLFGSTKKAWNLSMFLGFSCLQSSAGLSLTCSDHLGHKTPSRSAKHTTNAQK